MYSEVQRTVGIMDTFSLEWVLYRAYAKGLVKGR